MQLISKYLILLIIPYVYIEPIYLHKGASFCMLTICPLQSHNSAWLVHFFGMRNSEVLKFSRAKLPNSDSSIMVFPFLAEKGT